MSRDYITGEEKIPYGPDETIHPRLKTDLFFNYDAKGYAYLDRRGDAPINEAVVGVTLPGRCLSIFYAPTADADLVTAAAAALVVEMEPITDGATGLNRASAIYARLRTSATCKAVQGTGVAGEFEVVHPASVIVQSAYSVLRLVDRNDGVTVSANRAFITLRDYGTAAFQMPNLLNFWNYTKQESDSKILAHVGVAANIDGGIVGGCWPYNVAVRSVYDAANTPFWLLGTINPPTGLQDWHWAGSANGNHMFWDASGDQLSVIVAARTVNGEEEALDIAFTGTLSEDADHILGFNVAVVPAGVHGGWVSGGFIKVSMPGAGRPVDGYVSGLEIEVNHTAGVGVQCAYYVLNLNDNNGGVTASANRAFICLNDYGVAAYQMPHLFKFATQTLAAHDAGSIIVESTAIPAVDDNNWVCVRCLIGATPFWLIGTTTAPS